MSVLIKDMDMPSSCDYCGCFNNDGVNEWCALLDRCIDDSGKREDDCPLVEIPTPHGRLIDESKLEGVTYRIGAMGNWIEIDAPTVIEAEE